MADDGATGLSLDDVRDFLYVALRAQERATVNLKALIEQLDARKADEEWLEQAQEEAEKGFVFHEQQEQAWGGFQARVNAYVDAVRRDAEELVLQELRISEGDEDQEQAKEVDITRQARTIHPELKKFKLEKQARILGKYGGVPALGSGMVMLLPPKDAKLKATASPAAIEIQYSKVENKDAHQLAKVMQFKQRRATEAEGTPGAQSAWQNEVIEKKGQEYFKNRVSPAAASTTTHTPYSSELEGKLRSRQETIDTAEAASVAKPQRKPTDEATPELAGRLKKQADQLRAQELADATEARTPAVACTPFGGELGAALAQRRELAAAQQESTPGFKAAAAAIDDATTPSTPAMTLRKAPPPGSRPTPAAGAASNELAELLKKRQQQLGGE